MKRRKIMRRLKSSKEKMRHVKQKRITERGTEIRKNGWKRTNEGINCRNWKVKSKKATKLIR
jgi:hypothetical protein